MAPKEPEPKLTGTIVAKPGDKAKNRGSAIWPSSVLVFSPEDSAEKIEAIIDAKANPDSATNLFKTTGHFSSTRLAVLFKPGVYHANVQVGYYMQVLGLGLRPGDVSFTPPPGSTSPYRGVYSPAADPEGAGSLDTFWRAAENLQTTAANFHRLSPLLPNHMAWAVSQAAPIRRLDIETELWLFQLAKRGLYDYYSLYASGGFLSNVRSRGLNAGGQQQWLFRNSDFTGVPDDGNVGGAWSLVFAGCANGPPARNGPDRATYTVIETTPVSAEKPFITYDGSSDEYSLQVPLAKWDSRGVDFNDTTNLRAVPFEHVFVATPASVDSGELQGALDSERYLGIVLTPGIYNLSEHLVIQKQDQVVLGLGLATLIAPKDGSPCVAVRKNTFGVRLSGVMLQASALETESGQWALPGSTLISWGVDEANQPSDHDAGLKPEAAKNPSFLHDIFARVGGPDVDTAVNVDVMVRISASNVVGDNVWLWRADHSALAPGEEPRKGEKYHLVEHLLNPSGDANGEVVSVECRCNTGLLVTGDHVTMLGLAAEHTQKDNVVWEGEFGTTLFYQNEFPYDVTQRSFTDSATGQTYLGYKVADSAKNHEGQGLGVYSFFRDYEVVADTAIAAPKDAKFVNPFTKYLTGHGGIRTVLNGEVGPPCGTT